jgi:hypothetical protein
VVDEETRSPESVTTFSDGEGEESEADEGIHLPRKHHRPAVEVSSHSLNYSFFHTLHSFNFIAGPNRITWIYKLFQERFT